MKKLIAGAVLMVALVLGLASAAGATHIDVSVTSSCPGAVWTVVLHAHNVFTQPLTIRNDNSVEVYGAVLQPGQAIDVPIVVEGPTFHYIWSTPNGILVGTVEDTLTRPADCVVPTTTTTIPPETTTTTTTTTAPPPVLTPLPHTLEFGSASTVCSRDVPFVDITFGNQPQFDGIQGTITFKLLDGTFVEQHKLTYFAGETVHLLYPGASVDEQGNVDWPGWKLNSDGFWVVDPTDAAFRDGLVVEASLPLPEGFGHGLALAQVPGETVTATTTISYPPETAACNSPAGPFPPGPPPKMALPPTR